MSYGQTQPGTDEVLKVVKGLCEQMAEHEVKSASVETKNYTIKVTR